MRLIEERRKLPKEEKHRLKELSKKSKTVSDKKRVKRHRDIARIEKAKKRVLITKIKNKEGECITSRKGIADTFGEFYKRLYDERIPEITSEELQSAISKLKAVKSPDGDGKRAEDIKDCNDETRETMRQIFNEVIKRNNFTREE